MQRRNFLYSGILAGVTLNVPNIFGSNSIEKFSDKKPLKPLYIPPLKEPLSLDGPSFRFVIRSYQTNNQFTCVENIMNKKAMGPAPHVHKELDEIMFVQDGSITMMVGDDVQEIKAGGWHLRPHGIIHTFWNNSDKPARYIDMYFNQNFDDFLEERFQVLIPDMIKNGISLSSPEALKKINELNDRFGIIEYHEQRQVIIDKYGLTE